MVRDDTDARADGQRRRYLSEFLRKRNQPRRQRAQREIADDSVATIRIDVIGAGVFRQRQRAGVDDRFAAFRVGAYDRGQNGNGDIFYGT